MERLRRGARRAVSYVTGGGEEPPKENAEFIVIKDDDPKTCVIKQVATGRYFKLFVALDGAEDFEREYFLTRLVGNKKDSSLGFARVPKTATFRLPTEIRDAMKKDVTGKCKRDLEGSKDIFYMATDEIQDAVTLSNWLLQRQTPVEGSVIQKFACQLTYLLHHLHSEFGIQHNDIQEHNIMVRQVVQPETRIFVIAETGDTVSIPLVAGDLFVYIIDFGGAELHDGRGNDTFKWQVRSDEALMQNNPPERMLGAGLFYKNSEADTYMMGLVLLTLVAHRRGWKNYVYQDYVGVHTYNLQQIMKDAAIAGTKSVSEFPGKAEIILNKDAPVYKRYVALGLTTEQETKEKRKMVETLILNVLALKRTFSPNTSIEGFRKPVIDFANNLTKAQENHVNNYFEELRLECAKLGIDSFLYLALSFDHEQRARFSLPKGKGRWGLFTAIYHPYFKDFFLGFAQTIPEGSFRTSFVLPPLEYVQSDYPQGQRQLESLLSYIDAETQTFSYQFEVEMGRKPQALPTPVVVAPPQVSPTPPPVVTVTTPPASPQRAPPTPPPIVTVTPPATPQRLPPTPPSVVSVTPPASPQKVSPPQVVPETPPQVPEVDDASVAPSASDEGPSSTAADADMGQLERCLRWIGTQFGPQIEAAGQNPFPFSNDDIAMANECLTFIAGNVQNSQNRKHLLTLNILKTNSKGEYLVKPAGLSSSAVNSKNNFVYYSAPKQTGYVKDAQTIARNAAYLAYGIYIATSTTVVPDADVNRMVAELDDADVNGMKTILARTLDANLNISQYFGGGVAVLQPSLPTAPKQAATPSIDNSAAQKDLKNILAEFQAIFKIESIPDAMSNSEMEQYADKMRRFAALLNGKDFDEASYQRLVEIWPKDADAGWTAAKSPVTGRLFAIHSFVIRKDKAGKKLDFVPPSQGLLAPEVGKYNYVINGTIDEIGPQVYGKLYAHTLFMMAAMKALQGQTEPWNVKVAAVVDGALKYTQGANKGKFRMDFVDKSGTKRNQRQDISERIRKGLKLVGLDKLTGINIASEISIPLSLEEIKTALQEIELSDDYVDESGTFRRDLIMERLIDPLADILVERIATLDEPTLEIFERLGLTGEEGVTFDPAFETRYYHTLSHACDLLSEGVASPRELEDIKGRIRSEWPDQLLSQ